MSVAQKAKRELWEFALLSAYLYVCFGALILYKAAILQGEGISYLPFGLVAIKALILGKFILLGQAIRWGDRRGSHKRANDIAYKALLYLILLIVLSVVEEAVVAIIHGENIGPVLASHVGDKLPQTLAASVIMLLILIPYVASKELDVALGEGRLWALLFERQPSSSSPVIERGN